ncbi:GNAT family N-acetyltransferase [soil metagenome]
MRIVTRRLLLRPVVAGDGHALHSQVYGQSDVMRWLPGGTPLSKERSEAILAALDRHWDDHGYGVWAVTGRADGAVVGQCGFRHIVELGETELFYALGPGHWGKGYATEAARAAIDWARFNTALQRIIAFTKAGHVTSEAVLRKCTFRSAGPVRVFGLRAVAWTCGLGQPAMRKRSELIRG